MKSIMLGCYLNMNAIFIRQKIIIPSMKRNISMRKQLISSPRNLILSRSFSDYTPSSRKKNKQVSSVSSDGDNVDNLTMSTDEFCKEVDLLFDRIQKAVHPILILNPEYSFSYGVNDSLVLSVGSKGSYQFLTDLERQILMVRSPVSGLLQYTFRKNEKQWLGIMDNHDLRGLLTRDLIRHSVGLPHFD